MPEITAEQNFLLFHLRLLDAFNEQIQRHLPFNQPDCAEEDREFLQSLVALSKSSASPDFLAHGQELLCRIISHYPHLTPLLYRDLLWFFGGDCLHFMPESEIAKFQALDELRYTDEAAAKDFSYENARAKILGMH